MEYFVPDEATKLANDHLICIVGGQEEANIKATQNKQAYLEQESYRFTICKEEISGNDTIWCNADLENDTEEGTYHVFNQQTGLHEATNGLTNAIARMTQLKNEFINSYSWDVVEKNELPAKRIGAYSPQTYGNTVGDIPVEVM